MKELNDLLLHKATLAGAKAFVKKPPHALLITGAPGSGKLSLAQKLAHLFLQLPPGQQLQSYPYFTHLKRTKGKQDIPIDAVRTLTKLLKLKTPGLANVRRVVIIEDAQDLNQESASAMLKMLEEPASDSIFILTAVSQHSLLPTIASRAQHLAIRPVNIHDSLRFFSDRYQKKQIENAWQLSQGSPGLMLALLNDDQDHPLKLAIDNAKKYLRKNQYERLLLADALGKDKEQLAALLEALLKLLVPLHHATINRSETLKSERLIASRKLVHKLRNALEANVSPKLIALELSLNLV